MQLVRLFLHQRRQLANDAAPEREYANHEDQADDDGHPDQLNFEVTR